jgi:glycosyltransferase involved in cell wall biosynthesis
VTERLRIAVLSRNFATTGGGAERYSIAVVEELAARHEVHVFAQTIAHDFPGVTYHRIPMPMERPRWINQLYFAWKTWRVTRQGFDIVHSHENTWHGNVQTVHVLPVKHTLFAGKQGVALALRWLKVLTSPRLLAYLWLEKRRYAWALKKRVVCASSSLKAVLQATYPDSSSMLEVVTPGVAAVSGRASDTQRAQACEQLGLPIEPTVLLFVGNDFVKKGLPALLQALAQLPAQTQLAVVGNGESEPAMRKLTDRLGLTAHVHFLGSQRDMGLAYRAADALVHPTLEDAYGMVVLEAMAHGLPVVVSDTPYSGIAQDLLDGDNALLLKDPRDVAEIVATLQRLLNDVDLVSGLSTRALAFAQAHSWVRAAGAYEAMYLGIAKRYTQRWLVLSHAFNMDGRAASQTITDKLPHLEAAGIELVVLSGVSGDQDRHYEHHQLWPAGPAGIRFELRHVLRKHLPNPKAYRLVIVLLSLPLLPFMFIEKLLRPVESSWSWWFSAYLKGRALARHRKFDLIYSTGGAFAAHVAGRALKQALGVRWLAEVHDPLVMPGNTPSTAQERMQAEVERQICTDADVAIWFTEQALASARRRHPQLGERGKMLLPGIDAPFKVLPPYVPGPKMVIGHFGSLSTTRNLTPIIIAMEALVAQRPELRPVLELQLTGGPLDAVSQAAIAQSPVRDLVRHLGRIEADPVTGLSGREQILRRMRSVDVLLLLHGTEPICAEYIPSKLYEYLWMQRPILATVHGNSQMAGLLLGQGHSAIETQVAGAQETLSQAITQLFARWKSTGLADNGRPSPYTTQAAVDKLLGGLMAEITA